jgi:hypothetical protein
MGGQTEAFVCLLGANDRSRTEARRRYFHAPADGLGTPRGLYPGSSVPSPSESKPYLGTLCAVLARPGGSLVTSRGTDRFETLQVPLHGQASHQTRFAGPNGPKGHARGWVPLHGEAPQQARFNPAHGPKGH